LLDLVRLQLPSSSTGEILLKGSYTLTKSSSTGEILLKGSYTLIKSSSTGEILLKGRNFLLIIFPQCCLI
jgi:hypothetical protein